jgi:hypothetical protein
MRWYRVVLIAVATALVAITGTLLVTGYVHFGRQGPATGSVTRGSAIPSSSPSAIATLTPATVSSVTPGTAALETNPVLAKQYAEKAVGNCLEGAWGNAGYTSMFDSYHGNGVVEFRTGTPASPTGDDANVTLIDVHVYANGKVNGMGSGGATGGPPPAGKDNAALAYWGCQPSKRAASGVPQPVTMPRPPGLQKDGPLDVGCKLRGTPGYTSYQAVITLYNPGRVVQSVSSFLLEWGSNGVLLSQQMANGSWSVPPGQDITLTVGAPPSANSCQFGGFNQ